MAILYVAHAFGKRLRPVSPPAPKETARYPGLRVRTNGDFINVNLTVRPLRSCDRLRAGWGQGPAGGARRPRSVLSLSQF